MRLLVSVRDATEAAAALQGGADVVDAKEPFAGALGTVDSHVFQAIHRTVAGRRPVTAALGDASREDEIAARVRAFLAAGAAFVKVGFAGIGSAGQVERLLRAAVGAAQRPAIDAPAGSSPAHDQRAWDSRLEPRGGPEGWGGIVAVAYADYASAVCLTPQVLFELAARAGASGVLVDTFDKRRPGLSTLASRETVTQWADAVHSAGLFIAAAGRLAAADLPWLCECRVDVAGVRGAACDGERTSRVSAARVNELAKGLRACMSPRNSLG
jgi:uncharacterized protein (UPF0264 family)